MTETFGAGARPLSEVGKEQLIALYLTTSDGRTKLADAVYVPAHNAHSYAKAHPIPVSTVGEYISVMGRIQARLDGREAWATTQFATIDRFCALLRDLREVRGFQRPRCHFEAMVGILRELTDGVGPSHAPVLEDSSRG